MLISLVKYNQVNQIMALLIKKSLSSRPWVLGLVISYIMSGGINTALSEEYRFNSDVLDVNDSSNIDLDQFTRSGYIMPGDYVMAVIINRQELLEQKVTFLVPENDSKGSEACLTPELVKKFGLKPSIEKKLLWWHDGNCLVSDSIDGMTIESDLGAEKLVLNIPHAWLEYTSDTWDPPSRWDEGIPGVLIDYSVNGYTQRQQRDGSYSNSVSGNGTLGANVGAWRLRADWQSRFEQAKKRASSNNKEWDWSRYYAYRAIPQLSAKLSLGENYLNSDIFDSFRFAGVSLITDDTMLPPNLRGYAPEVTGIAKTNAKVIISQQGRVLQETQVPSGPFRIQDINNAVSGQLDIRIEEQDGSVQEFKMETANIPYLTRPGTVRYKVATGRSNDFQHQTSGPLFTTGEFSWGVSNGWSLYGGSVLSGDYNAMALGVGRDLMMFGALSFDATQSHASLPDDNKTLSGGSYRLSYSKRFDDYNSQITFAGYRFSQKNYMSMSEYIDARNNGLRSQNNKEMYSITYSKQFNDFGLSTYLNYNHQTYWDRSANDRYNLTLTRYFDIGRFTNQSLSLTGYRNKYNGMSDDGVYLSLSVPWGNSGSVSYTSTWDKTDNTHQASYYNRLDEQDTVQLSSGVSRNGAMASGFYNHRDDKIQVNTNVSYREGRYSSAGVTLMGGATATAKGAALHRSGLQGGTRMMLDTDGVSNIPIKGSGMNTMTNRFGTAVVPDVSSYNRSRISIDLNKLPENAEVIRSVVHTTLTEGAIGYRKFDIIAGMKAMAVIRLADGSTPPFGASVINRKKQEVGIVTDGGSVYLSGINPEEEMTVYWGGDAQCELALPAVLSNSDEKDLLLPCRLM